MTTHPSEYITDELLARGWQLEDLAHEMGGQYGINLLAIQLYITVGPDEKNCRMGDEFIEGLSKAFGTSKEVWEGLEQGWLKGRTEAQA